MPNCRLIKTDWTITLTFQGICLCSQHVNSKPNIVWNIGQWPSEYTTLATDATMNFDWATVGVLYNFF